MTASASAAAASQAAGAAAAPSTPVTSVLKMIAALISQTIAVGAFYNQIVGHGWQLVALGGFAGAIVGGLAWNALCAAHRRAGPAWSGLGGLHEPYGWPAFVWGAVTGFPVILGATLVARDRTFPTVHSVLLWLISPEFATVTAYTVVYGLSAIVYYGLSPAGHIRPKLQTSRYRPHTQETLLAAIWSGLLGLIPSTVVWTAALLAHRPLSRLSPLLALAPTVLGVLFTVIAVEVYYGGKFYRHDHDTGRQIRGIIAGLALRIGIYAGLVLILDGQVATGAQSWLSHWLTQPPH
jgi:hypothetical protein